LTASRSRVAIWGAVLFAVVALSAAAALRFGRPFPRRGAAVPAAPAGAWSSTDTLGRGESLAALLARGGLGGDDQSAAIRATAASLVSRRIPAGMEVRFSGDSTAGTDPRPADIALMLSADRTLHLVRAANEWSAREERTPWTTDTIVMHGVVHSNLYDAVNAGSGDLLSKTARAELAWAVADIFEYRIDMSRDLQDGDAVRAVFERARSPSGLVRIGAILAAGLERSGAELQAIRFVPRGEVKAQYFDQDGRSLRATFLRAPLSFRRISSVFGMREHPILGEWRSHKGTDYAAASGTPVRSIGNGVVVFAGVRGGYGNSIDVRHPNGFVTRYGHLKGFASGVRNGARVSMGQTIGYVGMTGLATGPHLHFEVIVGGVQRDPRTALKSNAGPPLASGELAVFDRVRHEAVAQLDQAAGVVRTPGVASR
jgi:murein DD-endopeptidase MepM/ murein hydrolase activator NlpD